MRKHWEGNGVASHMFQNIWGTDKNGGLEINTKIDVIKELGINTQGYVESNVLSIKGNKSEYDFMLGLILDNPKTIYLS